MKTEKAKFEIVCTIAQKIYGEPGHFSFAKTAKQASEQFIEEHGNISHKVIPARYSHYRTL